MKLLFLGDVMTGRGIDQILPHPSDPRLYEESGASALDYVRLAERANGPIRRPASFAYPWGDALAARQAAAPDLVIANLETAITRSAHPVPKGINYRMSPGNARCLSAIGINACSLANNHVLDWGRAGLAETLKTLDAEGVRAVGAGRDLAAATAPLILDAAGGARVLLIACAIADSGVPSSWAAGPERPGLNLVPLSDETVSAVARAFETVKRAGDAAVVSIHWGPNWGYEISSAQRRFAQALVDRANVAVVHGHSSHHPKAIEVYDGRLILYGCGDFLNDYEGIAGYESFRGDLVAAYLAEIDAEDGRLRELEVLPFQIHRARLRRASDQDLEWFAQRLGRECAGFGGRIERSDGRLKLRWPQADA
jgi:poly-gamma-glutamate synthesis protein (capsule biosynthesis protein)